ncbi:MAG: AmmeMemoRadiSam system protein B, partial [Candidatus Aenigmatarchaeota archaeon]
MKKYVLALVLLVLVSGCTGKQSVVDEGKPVIREPAVAGRFYPSDPEELKAMIDDYLGIVEEGKIENVRGLVEPHAGYI